MGGKLGACGVVARCDVTHALTNNPVIFFIKKFGLIAMAHAFFFFFAQVGFTLHGNTYNFSRKIR